MNNACRLLALTTTVSCALAAAPSLAHAQRVAEAPAITDTIRRDRGAARPPRRNLKVALETTAMLGIGTAWYWRRDDQGTWGGANVVDWQLGFRGAALGSKLRMSDAGWRFDGNSFGLNAVGHPMFGALTYWNARRHGLGPGGSFLVSTAASGAWEMFTEWAEYGSINDALSTSTTGVPLGEAGYQLYRNWRKARYTVTAGAGTAGGTGLGVLAGKVELDTLPADGAGRFYGGRRVALGAELQTDADGVRGVEGSARTTLAGYHVAGDHHRIVADLGADFSYRDQKDRTGRAWDLLSTVGIGPSADVRVERGGLQLDAGIDARLAFGMTKAQAWGAWREANPAERVRNSMQDKAQPYYYARAFAAKPRITVRYGGLEVGATMTGYKLDSLDGADRDQEMITADPHITDTDVSSSAWIGFEHDGVRLSLDRRTHARRGSMDGAQGSAGEETTILGLSFTR